MKTLFTFLALMSASQIFAQQNISDVRKMDEGKTVTITGIVSNGDELGLVKYMQDLTGGLAVYDDKLKDVKRGDSITVSGKIESYNNLFEIVSVSSLSVAASGVKLPEPKNISINEIGEDYEGQLIQINNIEIENANGNFSGNSNYNFTDGNTSGIFRINSSSPIVGQTIPSGKFNLVAICSQYSFSSNDTRSGYQLLPRDMDDFLSKAPINFTSPVSVANITKNSLTLSWKTDVESTPMVSYQLAYSPHSWVKTETGTSQQNGVDVDQTVVLTDLDPASFVLATAYSISGTDTLKSQELSFITASNSSGEIKAFFNTPVNTDVSTGSNAQYIERAMNDTLITFINKAKESIDFCIYNINNNGLSNVSEALNKAKDRGVRVRFITCGSTAHSGVRDLDSDIPVEESPYNSTTGIMHNKFAVIDALSADHLKPWVWSGSTNLTYDQVNTDANNMIFIQDKSLALAYHTEFEEMWGSTDLQPNLSKAKFGADKTDNTPHEFVIGGNRVELYFSPSDGTNQQIINAIHTADNDLHVQTMLITRSDIANAIRSVKEKGIEVHVITDRENDNSETVNNILNDALPPGKFVFDDIANATLHHKMAIVDANYAASDPQVITGSHNWSNAANDRNDENTLIIHNAEIANQYFQQFAYRFAENNGSLFVTAEIIEIANIKVYPNPAVEKVIISSAVSIKNIQLYSVTGILLIDINQVYSNQYELDLGSFNAGLYMLKIQTENNKSNVYKIIKK